MTAQAEVPVPDLTQRLRRVVAARRAMERMRCRPAANRSEMELARHMLVDALDEYIAGLTAMNSPVPYRMRDELRLNRAVDIGT